MALLQAWHVNCSAFRSNHSLDCVLLYTQYMVNIPTNNSEQSNTIFEFGGSIGNHEEKIKIPIDKITAARGTAIITNRYPRLLFPIIGLPQHRQLPIYPKDDESTSQLLASRTTYRTLSHFWDLVSNATTQLYGALACLAEDPQWSYWFWWLWREAVEM